MKIRKRRGKILQSHDAKLYIASGVFLLFMIGVFAFGVWSHNRVNEMQKEVAALEKKASAAEKRAKEAEKKLADIEAEKKAEEEKAALEQEAIETAKTDPAKKKVYLTFDDGPTENTELVLDTLKEYNVKATFFTLARDDDFSVRMYKRIVDEGHTLAMHSYTHQYDVIYSSFRAYKNDVNSIRNHLEQITGVRPKFYRFPGGSSNQVSEVSMEKCIKWLTKQGITYFDWNAVNGDAEGKDYSVKKLVKNTIKYTKECGNTVVVLMHDGADKANTAKALPQIIEQLREMDCVLLPIDDDTPLIQHVPVDSIE